MDNVVKVILKSIIINTFLVISKIVIGILGSSKALIANAVHSLSDLITDIISIIGYKFSKKESDIKHPLGYGQIEYLTSIIVGMVILFLGLKTVVNAFDNKINIPSNLIIITSFIAMIAKYILATYILKKGKEYKNSILIVSGIESRADALTSSLVLISAILSKLTPYNSLYKYSDNVSTFIIGLYIVYIAYKILKENILNIIGTNEENINIIDTINKIILTNKEVYKIKDLNLIKYGSYYVATIELILNKNITLKHISKLKNKIRKELMNTEFKISYLTISVDIRKVI